LPEGFWSDFVTGFDNPKPFDYFLPFDYPGGSVEVKPTDSIKTRKKTPSAMLYIQIPEIYNE